MPRALADRNTYGPLMPLPQISGVTRAFYGTHALTGSDLTAEGRGATC